MAIENSIQLWQPSNTTDIKENSSIANTIRYSDDSNLTSMQKTQIVNAFNAKAYDMATEYTWNKAMVRLKEMLSGLGGNFIGAMLKRADIDGYSDIVNSLSDIDAIFLSENLGILSTEGAMQLRHAKEEINYYFSSEAATKRANLDAIHSLQIISDCVKYILSINNSSSEMEFSHFREKLTKDTLTTNDKEYKQIEEAPLFYLRTICNMLLSSIETSTGGQLDNSLTNLNLIIDMVWPKLSDDDKWNIGNAYRNVYSAGNEKAASGLRQALRKVKGFDFVPENLRSDTFIAAAKRLMEAHYEFNNFYNEPLAAEALANLGTIIPKPAFMACMKAYLCILMGNTYGVSIKAVPIVTKELLKVSKERWSYYFNNGIIKDDDVLDHFKTREQVQRFSFFIINNNFNHLVISTKDGEALYKAIVESDYNKAIRVATCLFYQIRGLSR